MAKEVARYEEYEHRGTRYLLVTTNDDWIYRFQSPRESVPYEYEWRQRPDGTRSFRDCNLPDDIVSFLEDSVLFDVSDLKGRQSAKRRED